MNAFIRFKLGLTEDNPTIKPYNEDLWVKTEENELLSHHVSLNLLENIRLGNINDEDKEILNKCINKKIDDMYNITPTILFSRKKDVQDYNKIKLKELLINNHDIKTFESKISYNKKLTKEREQMYKEKLNKTYNIEDYLILTINTQVMLTVNKLDEKLSNGSRGIIIDFNPYPVVQFYNGIISTIFPNEWKFEEDNNIIIKKQIPLIHAWSITIHKSQGMSIDCLITDIGSSIFECGQIYVALSRVKNIKYLSIRKIDYSKIRSNQKIINFYKNLI
jgi:ATP-dependent DNA helicase PIF1